LRLRFDGTRVGELLSQMQDLVGLRVEQNPLRVGNGEHFGQADLILFPEREKSGALGPLERRHGLTSKLQLTGSRVGRHAGSRRAP